MDEQTQLRPSKAERRAERDRARAVATRRASAPSVRPPPMSSGCANLSGSTPDAAQKNPAASAMARRQLAIAGRPRPKSGNPGEKPAALRNVISAMSSI
jgi:hypothetical protein